MPSRKRSDRKLVSTIRERLNLFRLSEVKEKKIGDNFATFLRVPDLKFNRSFLSFLLSFILESDRDRISLFIRNTCMRKNFL